MRHLSRTQHRRIVVIASVLALGAGGVGVAQATGSDAEPKPPPKPLAAAVLDAMSAPRIDGVVADLEITNRLVPAGVEGSALFAEHAEAELRLDADGGLRVDVHGDAGDAELTIGEDSMTLYDEVTDTELAIPLPKAPPGDAAPGAGGFGAPPLDAAKTLGSLMERFSVSGAEPATIAGRAAYTARVSARDDGGLLAAAELSWDAERAVPLRFAVFAQGDDEPVFEAKVTDISFESVPEADVRPTPHPGAERMRLEPGDPADGSLSVSGAARVQQHLPFELSAPAELAGLPRSSVRLIGHGGGDGALLTYGEGLGTIVVVQTESAGDLIGEQDPTVPRVNIDGRTGVEIANPLGTSVAFERDGVTFLVGGLVPPVAVENAARGL